MKRQSPELYRARRQAEEDAGREINHIGSAESDGINDKYVCSCGWKSEVYNDGPEFARRDWANHIRQHGAEVNYPEPTE